MPGLAIVALAAIGVGFGLGAFAGTAAFAAGVLALLLHHLRERHRLARWIERGESDAPAVHGEWDRLHAVLHRSRREALRREAALADSVRRWQEAARALPEGVVILEDERIAWCNDMARLHLDIDPAKDAGRPITHFVRTPEFARYLALGEFSHPVMVESTRGGERVLSIQVVPYGESERLVLSRDITQFQKVDRMRREFVANVSHELRTPLTVISGFVETLREERDPEAARRFLGLMAEQARRMERLVEDLLTLSSLESAPPPPLGETVAMGALVERLAAEARALSAGRHRIEVDVSSACDLLGSEKELASAFGNLVSNAIRYTPPGGRVALRWRDHDEGAAFEVADTGIGIAREHIPRLTERFYRVDRGRSRETGGTGLGLAIVKHALVRHGATLHVESEPGEGSTFSARFSGPRVRPPRG